MDSRKLAPGLLLAMPQLPDPNFERSVVLMVEHNEEGSWGLIVNRPTDLAVTEVMGELEIDWSGSDDEVVWQGGPVEPYRGCVLHPSGLAQTDPEPQEILPGISLSTLPEQLQLLARNPDPALRFILGYAGWGAGQLEGEMTAGAWLLAPASPELIFRADPNEMWNQAIGSLGVDPTTLVPAEGIH